MGRDTFTQGNQVPMGKCREKSIGDKPREMLKMFILGMYGVKSHMCIIGMVLHQHKVVESVMKEERKCYESIWIWEKKKL